MKIVDADGNDASGAARKAMGAERYYAVMRYANYTVERGIRAARAVEAMGPRGLAAQYEAVFRRS